MHNIQLVSLCSCRGGSCGNGIRITYQISPIGSTKRVTSKFINWVGNTRSYVEFVQFDIKILAGCSSERIYRFLAYVCSLLLHYKLCCRDTFIWTCVHPVQRTYDFELFWINRDRLWPYNRFWRHRWIIVYWIPVILTM